MRVLALVLATLLLAAPLAAGQTNNTTSSDENQTATDQEGGGTNDTSQADGGDEEGNITLPDRSGQIPWAGLAVGLIIFAAAVLVSRVTYHGHD